MRNRSKSISVFLAICLSFIIFPLFAAPIIPDTLELNWLETASLIKSGVSWGVPWPKGAVKKNQSFVLTTSDGKSLPLQTCTLAYWPYGSVKWSGFATVSPVLFRLKSIPYKFR